MLIEFAIKLIASIPSFASAIMVLDILAIKIKNEITIGLIYYYGYIQVYAFILFIFQGSENFLMRIILMPAQVGNLFINEFSIGNCAITFFAGLLHIVLILILSTNSINKKMDLKI